MVHKSPVVNEARLDIENKQYVVLGEQKQKKELYDTI